MGVLDWLQDKYTGPNGKLTAERERRLTRSLEQSTRSASRPASPAAGSFPSPQRTRSASPAPPASASASPSGSSRGALASPRLQPDRWPLPPPSGPSSWPGPAAPYATASRSSSPGLGPRRPLPPPSPASLAAYPAPRPASPATAAAARPASLPPSAPLHRQAQARLLAQAQAQPYGPAPTAAAGRSASPHLRDAYDHHPASNQTPSPSYRIVPPPGPPLIYAQPRPMPPAETWMDGGGPEEEEEEAMVEAQAQALRRAEAAAAAEAAQCGRAEADARQAAVASLSAAATARREAELLEAAASQTEDVVQRQWVFGAAVEARAKAQAHGAEASQWLAEADQFRSASADATEQTRLLQTVRVEVEAPLAGSTASADGGLRHPPLDGALDGFDPGEFGAASPAPPAELPGSAVAAACLQLEERWQRWGGRPLTFRDLARRLRSHALVWTPHTAPPACDGCGWQAGLWACPQGLFQVECQHCLWACQSCYDSGLQLHSGPLSGSDRAYALAALQHAFAQADAHGHGAVAFLEFLHLMVVLNRHPWPSEPDRPLDGTEVLLMEFEEAATADGLPYPALEAMVARHVGNAAALPQLWALHAGGWPGAALRQAVAVLFAALRPVSPFLAGPGLRPEPAAPPALTVRPSSTRILPEIVNFELRQLRRVRLLGHDERCVSWMVEYAGLRCVAKWPLTITTAEERQATFLAAALQGRVRHPNLQRVLAAVPTGPLPTLLLEPATSGDLTDWYGAAPPGEIQWLALRQVAEAVCVLHGADPPIVHRNLQGQSVLLTEDQEVKLGGFDLAAELPPARPSLSEVCGALGFTAPEVLAGSPYDCLADVYSFGCLMYEVAHGHPPFAKELEERPPPPGTAWAAALAALTLEGRRPALSDRACPPGLRALIRDCWVAVPTQRPPMAEVVQRLDRIRHQFTGGPPTPLSIAAHLPPMLENPRNTARPFPGLTSIASSPRVPTLSAPTSFVPSATARHRSYSPSLAQPTPHRHSSPNLQAIGGGRGGAGLVNPPLPQTQRLPMVPPADPHPPAAPFTLPTPAAAPAADRTAPAWDGWPPDRWF